MATSIKGVGMGAIERVTVALTAELAAEVREAVEAGTYASASDVVRDALYLWQQRRELEELELTRLRRLVAEVDDNGSDLDLETAFDELEARYVGNEGSDAATVPLPAPR
jgi:antitoxin ParD1/3/4